MPGLESLIPKKTKREISQKKKSVFWIETNKIKPNPLQPRKYFNQKELKDLASSIEKYGILQPLIAKKIEKDIPSGQKVEYQLIAGERRLRAAKMIGLKEVPVIVEEITKEAELPISLVENIQREDLNAVEKAKAFKKLVEEYHLTQKEIGQMIGKSREVITNTLRLLDLPEEIKQAVEKGEITEGHARALLSVEAEKQIEIYKEIVEKKLPVRAIEKEMKIRKEKGAKEKEHLQRLEKTILKSLKTKNFKIKEVNNKIELTLIFENEKELKKFLSTLQ